MRKSEILFATIVVAIFASIVLGSAYFFKNYYLTPEEIQLPNTQDSTPLTGQTVLVEEPVEVIEALRVPIETLTNFIEPKPKQLIQPEIKSQPAIIYEDSIELLGNHATFLDLFPADLNPIEAMDVVNVNIVADVPIQYYFVENEGHFNSFMNSYSFDFMERGNVEGSLQKDFNVAEGNGLILYASGKASNVELEVYYKP